MIHVGITGGIGSGKSFIARIFQSMGIPVLNADTLAKKLMEEDTELKQELIHAFGKDTFKNGRLNRPFLASQAFSSPEKTALLNSLVHPRVIAYSRNWASEQKKVPFTLKEAALLFESGSYKDLDQIIGVYCPLNTRIARVQKRDGLTPTEILQRIEKQMDEAEKMKRCDFVIVNDDEQPLLPQVMRCFEQLKTHSN